MNRPQNQGHQTADPGSGDSARFEATQRRYARGCSRPGCKGEPIATMSYDHAAAVVYVGQLIPEREPSMYDLCRRHVDALNPPKGWVVRREPLNLVGIDGQEDSEWHTRESGSATASKSG